MAALHTLLSRHVKEQGHAPTNSTRFNPLTRKTDKQRDTNYVYMQDISRILAILTKIAPKSNIIMMIKAACSDKKPFCNDGGMLFML